MARKPAPSRKVEGVSEPPEFMKKHAKEGTENLGPEDTVWLGKDGSLDPDDQIQQKGFDPDEPLKTILSAIIDAHPIEGSSTLTRMEIALSALTGSGRNAGRDVREDDYDLLLEIAWRFHLQFHDQHEAPALAPIIEGVIKTLDPLDPRRHMIESDSAIRRLRRKFLTERDTLLVRVTNEIHPDRLDRIREMNRIIAAMIRLGIPATPNFAKPRFRPGDR